MKRCSSSAIWCPDISGRIILCRNKGKDFTGYSFFLATTQVGQRQHAVARLSGRLSFCISPVSV
ncbi:MAG: hypothetical protein GXO58_02290 [Thermodesulfobacteria bacterium]|nr:hypothetical protein [Thermodesulfobacteriota bacterium]